MGVVKGISSFRKKIMRERQMIKENMIKPFLKIQPKDMKPLEQVLCMVYLAQSLTLEELRFRQELVEKQLHIANSRRMDPNNLLAMQSNIDAAVAYQSFPDDLAWMSFIKMD